MKTRWMNCKCPVCVELANIPYPDEVLDILGFYEEMDDETKTALKNECTRCMDMKYEIYLGKVLVWSHVVTTLKEALKDQGFSNDFIDDLIKTIVEKCDLPG